MLNNKQEESVPTSIRYQQPSPEYQATQYRPSWYNLQNHCEGLMNGNNLPDSPPGYTKLNDGYAKIMSEVPATSNLLPSQEPKYVDQVYFGWDSGLQDKRTTQFQLNTEKELDVIKNAFLDTDPTTEQNVVKDYNGNLCINSDAQKKWFAKNVALVFATGAIYDANDNKIMNTILGYFANNMESAFLKNLHRVEAYDKSELVKNIEKKLNISNGNYHVLLVPIVYANDEEVLSHAPEPKYSISGICDKYIRWKDITEYMQTIIAKYGFITHLERAHDAASWEIGTDNLAVKRSPHNDVECDVNVEILPELHDTPIQKNLRVKSELEEDFNVRQHKTKMNRLGDYDVSMSNKRMTLYEQMYGGINDSGIVNGTVFDGNLGVQLRLNERKMPENKKLIEYQIYDDDDTYENGQNIISQMSVTPKIDMPSFPITNSRGSKAREPSMGNWINNQTVTRLPSKSAINMYVGHMAPNAVHDANVARQQGINARIKYQG